MPPNTYRRQRAIDKLAAYLTGHESFYAGTGYTRPVPGTRWEDSGR